MFCEIQDLKTESDVEQKLIWQILTSPYPQGLGFHSSDVATKHNIRRLEIGKGNSRKIYYPDYIVIIAGLPVLVIEAKSPNESVEVGLEEARLYGNELNALLPSGINPCTRVIASNGIQLQSSPTDTATADINLAFQDISVSNKDYAQLIETCSRSKVQSIADAIRRKFKSSEFFRPLNLLGGQSVRNEQVAQNTFGATIAGDYGHLFNPSTREDRAHVVKNAYVPSLRRTRYVEPIDRLIRGSVPPSVTNIIQIEDSAKPSEITTALRDRKSLENQIMLLVGSVGAGKSTFVDYLSEVALPKDLLEKTIWVRLNLNEAPISKDLAYTWVSQNITSEIRRLQFKVDFDSIEIIQKVFGAELNALKKGPLALLPQDSMEYRTRLSDKIISLQNDPLATAKAMTRFACAGPGRLLIVALDNCDKRNRDEQLTMFQVAHWVQREFRCLVILPLRDVTYDLHKHEPPLDTALKGLVFRIEPPLFSEVLQNRIMLALREIKNTSNSEDNLSYQLPNGIKVTYPASDQAMYLASILKSLYAHDKFVRQIISGLAGRDVRRAMEIFLDFCTSGHIGEDDIYKIRVFEGKHVLPFSLVARVLLRMQRRYYDGDKSYIKNLVQCSASDPLPDHFVRVTILRWLEQNRTNRGPSGASGFHRTGVLMAAMSRAGHDSQRTRSELLYLLRERCVVAEHLRTDDIAEEDLISISPSGVVHLQLMANADYLAACAEDTWMASKAKAEAIAERIARHDTKGHFSKITISQNANDLVGYLREQSAIKLAQPSSYLNDVVSEELNILKAAESAIAATELEVSRRVFVANMPFGAEKSDVVKAFDAAGLPVVDVHILVDKKTGRPRGCGFVNFKDGKAALQALERTNTISLKGRFLRIDEATDSELSVDFQEKTRTPVKVTDRVFVAGLAYDATKGEVQKAFEAHGFFAKEIFLPFDKAKGRIKGIAFVTVGSPDEAIHAIGALNNTTLGERRIKVSAALSRPQPEGRIEQMEDQDTDEE